jgi:small subunit ribosomal protein S4
MAHVQEKHEEYKTMKIGPKYKISRYLGEPVFPKCETPKFAISRAKKGGKSFRKQKTEYGAQLIEKQKVRYTYNITEKQMSNYVKSAQEKKSGSPHETLFNTLEMRLDNILYRAGFIPTRQFARQVVSHGHVLVNGVRTRVPSFILKKGDIVSVRKESREKGIFKGGSEQMKLKGSKAPEWISVDPKQFEIKITGTPQFGSRHELTLDFGQVIEFYSRV